jgi:hypothetical protein
MASTGAAGKQRPPGLFEQFASTRESVMRLVQAHIALFRAELKAIVDQLKGMAAAAAIALVMALLVGNMLYIGGFLFLGEWLFGSIGWGLAHGILLGVAIIVIALLALLGVRRRTPLSAFLLALVPTVAIALFAGLNIGYDTATYFAGQLAAPFNSIGLVAALAGAVVGGIVLLILLGFVGGLSAAIAGFVLGAILGLLFGWLLGGAPWTWPPAAGFAITVGLLLWPILAALLARSQIDLEKRFGGLYPRQSIEAVNETKSWLEEQWRTRLPTRDKK